LPSKEPPPPALALYLVIELIDLDPVIGIDVSSLLENCCDAPVFPLLKAPFDLVETITTSFNAFDSSLTTTLTVKLLPKH
jgi:hypothetical protein